MISDPNECDALHYIISGSVRAEAQTTCPDRKPITVMLYGRGSTMGVSAYFNSRLPARRRRKLQPVRYAAVGNVHLAAISYHRFAKLLESTLNPYQSMLEHALLETHIARNSDLVARLRSVHCDSTEHAVLSALEHMAEATGSVTDTGIQMHVPAHRHIAELAGYRRETVGRTLVALQERGDITVLGKQITLNRPTDHLLNHLNERDHI